ncbi:MAG: phosphoglycerate kinase [Elusimicrobiota bacterium]|jgi:phosphoglycerate kinase
MSTATIPPITQRTVDTLPVQGKRVFVRVDYNVPLNDEGVITDDTRIRETLPTLQFLLQKGAALILAAHLGRPKGKPDPKYSLKPVAKRLEELLKRPVQFAPDCIGPDVTALAQSLKAGDILLLENLRFHAEEEGNAPAFAQALAALADVFVQDAFGAVHRAHASTVGVAQLLPSAAGLLLAKEIFYLSKTLENPERPFIAILGGSKVSDKIEVIESLLDKVNGLVIGGAMAYTFLKAQGIEVGNSKVEPDKVDVAKSLLKKAQEKHVQVFLPQDHLIVEQVDTKAPVTTTTDRSIPVGWIGVDIGPQTIKSLLPLLQKAKTVLWNGPMGIFEMPPFATGTLAVAKALAESTKYGATTIVGGGDSVAAVKQAGVANELSHISTGGGASLEFLEGKLLPGIAALPNA